MYGDDARLERPRINGRPSVVWYVVWSEPGRRSRRVSTRCEDRPGAERFLARWLAAQASLTPEGPITCRVLSAAYLSEARERKVAYPKALENCLRHTDAAFGDLTPELVTPPVVRRYVARRQAAGVTNSTIDKELRIFRQTLKFGVREGWMSVEPKIRTPGGGAPRQRFLLRSEFASIYLAASPLHLRTFLALAIDTLARGKAILALRWSDVDFERRIVWYPPTSPGAVKRRVATPMSERLAVALEQAQAAALSDYVIEWRGRRVKSVRRAYERACKAAGVKDAHKHDLRRSGASWAIQDGQSFDAVAALLGDSVEITRKTYAVFSPTYLRGVVDSIGQGSGGRA